MASIANCFAVKLDEYCELITEVLRNTPLVRVVGLEPTRLAALDPKSSASANSATPAYLRPKPQPYRTANGMRVFLFNRGQRANTLKTPIVDRVDANLVLLYSRPPGAIESIMAYIYEKLHD